jgi:hypothetical protein
MEEKELIKNYLKSINFSTYESYINLILGYVDFKEQTLMKEKLKETIKENIAEKPKTKEVKK